MLKKVFKLVLGLFFAILFIWLLVRQINVNEIKSAFYGTNKFWIISAILSFIAGYSCRIKRWQVMLQKDNSILRWADCAGPFLGSFAANNVLPFRAGDILRVFAFNSRLGVSSGIVVATLFVERLLDLLMVLMFLGVAIFLVDIDSIQSYGFISVALIVFSFLLLLLLLYPRYFAPFVAILVKFVALILPNFKVKLLNEINKFLDTLIHLSTGHIMSKLIIWSILSWLAEGCVFLFAALALASIVNPIAAWVALPVGTLATLIPSTPGYVGTFDYFTTEAMKFLGNNIAASTAFAFLVHALLWFPPTIIGGLYLIIHPAKNYKNL